MGPRTKRSDDGPAMCGGPISFAAEARPLRKSRSSKDQLVEIGGQLVRWSASTESSTPPATAPLSQLVENDVGWEKVLQHDPISNIDGPIN
jgi:hypothetical protein